MRCRTGGGGGDDGWFGVAVFGGALRGGDAIEFRGTGGGHDVAADCMGVLGREPIGFTLGEPPAPTPAGAGMMGNSSPQLTAAPTGISPPQTEQRARIDTLVIFAGSSRKTVRHSGQETFIGIEGSVESAGPSAAARV